MNTFLNPNGTINEKYINMKKKYKNDKSILWCFDNIFYYLFDINGNLIKCTSYYYIYNFNIDGSINQLFHDYKNIESDCNSAI